MPSLFVMNVVTKDEAKTKTPSQKPVTCHFLSLFETEMRPILQGKFPFSHLPFKDIVFLGIDFLHYFFKINDKP